MAWNYPDDMSYNDLVHVGEYSEPDPEPRYCQHCGDELNEDEEEYCEHCLKIDQGGY